MRILNEFLVPQAKTLNSFFSDFCFVSSFFDMFDVETIRYSFASKFLNLLGCIGKQKKGWFKL